MLRRLCRRPQPSGFQARRERRRGLRTSLPAYGLCLYVSLWTLAGCASLVQSAKNQPCVLDPVTPFDVVEVDPERYDIRLFWKDAQGERFGTIENLRAWLRSRGDSLVAATNAGIYEPGYVPTGLYVEDGKELRPLNLADGEGNFFLKPNGVFVLTPTGARVVASTRLAALGEPIRYATQSGPLLVEQGRVHPAFTEGSSNCRLRSGVGVHPDGTVYLAISNGAVNFYDFAAFFRDVLGTPDALYLDGGISRLYAPGSNRMEDSEFAAILGVLLK